MNENEEITFSGLVYDKDEIESVDFELAFTTFLATAGLATLSGPSTYQIILKIVFVLLILLTMVRRMATTSRYTDRSTILAKTMRPIELLSILAFFQIFVSVSDYTIQILQPNVDVLFLVGLIFPGAVLLMVILQEFLFKNYFVLWASLYFGKAVANKERMENASNPWVEFRSKTFTNLWANLAFIALSGSLANSLPEELKDLEEFHTDISGKIERGEVRQPSHLGFMLFAGFIVVPVFISISYGLSILLGSLGTAFILVISIWLVKHIVGFWYIAHGTESDERLLHRGFTMLPVYALVTYLVFSLRIATLPVPFG